VKKVGLKEQAGQLPPEQLLTAVVAGSDDAIISKDLNGIIMSWNDAARRIFGYTPSEVLGRPITILIPPDRRGEEADILARLRAGERIDHFETMRITKDGRLLNISLTISPIRGSNGAIIGASKIARDITADKSARRALAQAHEQLKLYADRLEAEVAVRTAQLRDSIEELETFSSSIPHDIKGPLRGICTFVEILRDDHRQELSPVGQTILDRLIHSCARLQRFLDNVLTYARTRHARLQLHRVELAAVVPGILEEYPHAKKANAEVTILQPLLPVKGDQGLLAQAIANLISNAVKFVAPGTRPAIRIWTERHDGDLRLWIQDNGIGIQESDREKIFGLFTRLHHESLYEGTGVGLAVVQRALSHMNGTVGVESEPGKGSRFWIQLKPADS
jgi:PAS domain S-box-containing protein